MRFISQVFAGRRSRSQRQNESNSGQASPPTGPRHALDTLPALPSPRRPITPTAPHTQPQSPFFTLPPELRQQIYRLLLSNHEIHLDMSYIRVESTTPHSTRGASFDSARRWRWRASICHRDPHEQPITDRCAVGGGWPTVCHLFDTSCAIGKEVLGLLRSCRLAYREAVQVLYGENTFHVCTGALVLYTDRLLPAAGAVTRLVYQVTEESVWDYAEEHLGIEPGLAAYGVLLGRVPRAFPSLVRLLVVVQGKLHRGRAGGNGEFEPLDGAAARDCLLSSMDAAVTGFRRPMVECVLAMRDTAFDHLFLEERDGAEKVESREGMWLQFWRAVSVARGDDSDEALGTGYWVRSVVSPNQSPGALLDIDLGAFHAAN